MAFDAFLKIEGIGGAVSDKSSFLEIELESFSWGVSNPSTIGSATGGAGSGKVSFQDFSFGAVAGVQSPKLFEAAARGQHISTAILTVSHKTEMLTVTFTDVLISSYKLDEGALFTQKFAEGGLPAVQLGAPMESVSFNFGELKFEVGNSVGFGIPLGQ